MKTLDEVIKALEKKLDIGGEDAVENCLETDALQYLKEYQHWQEIMEEVPSYYEFVKMQNGWKEQSSKFTPSVMKGGENHVT